MIALKIKPRGASASREARVGIGTAPRDRMEGPCHRKDAKSAKERGVEKAHEAFGTPTRLPRELDRRSDQGRHPADGQWVIVQLARILRAPGVFAVNLPIDVNRM